MKAGSLIAFTALVAGAVAQLCNPLEQSCPDAIPGFDKPYMIDFTKQTNFPNDEWILADFASVTFDTSNGANFSFLKRYDAPYIWTRRAMLFGRVDVELQAAPGSGLITGAVLMSDDKDELDFEFSGNNFGHGSDSGLVQTNWYGKGITGTWSRGTQEKIDSPQTKFHTYTFDWTKDGVKWILDGNEVHSITNNGDTSGEYQFPQTPARLHLGIWNAGDPDTPAGTRDWAGGLLDMSKLPYSAYVKSVKISPYTPCSSWQYPANFSGKWDDVKCTNQTISLPSTSATTTSSAPRSNATSYIVKEGDYGSKIAQSLGCSFDDLSKANPGLNWDLLLVGQTITVPGAASPTTQTAQLANSTAPTNIQNSDSIFSATTGQLSASNPSSLYSSYTTSSSIFLNSTGSATTKIYTNTNIATVSTKSGTEPYAGTTCLTVTITVTAPCNASSGPVLVSSASNTKSQDSLQSSSTSKVQPSTLTKSLTLVHETSMIPAGSNTTTGSKPVISTASSSMVPSIPSQAPAITTKSNVLTRNTSTSIGTPSHNTYLGSTASVYSTATSAPPTSHTIVQPYPGTNTSTAWRTQTTVSTFTVTEPCTVCQTITKGSQVSINCSQSMNTTVSSTAVITVVPVTAQVNPVPASGTPLTSHTDTVSSSYSLLVPTNFLANSSTALLNSSRPLPTAPFLTTATVPCTSCSKGIKTVTSTCSTVVSVATVTVPCHVCEGGLKTITTTTTMSLTHSPYSTRAPFSNSSVPDHAKLGNSSSISIYDVTSTASSTVVSSQTYLTSTRTGTSASIYNIGSLTGAQKNTTLASSSTSISSSAPSLYTTSNSSTMPTTPYTNTASVALPIYRNSTSTNLVVSTSSTASPSCNRDACLDNMLDKKHIEDAHSSAHQFCKDSTQPTPTWLSACANKASATSAFQCVTASVTPAPSEDKDGKKCFLFNGQKIWSNRYGQNKQQMHHERQESESEGESKGYINKLWRFTRG